jgi:hypothetical protein
MLQELIQKLQKNHGLSAEQSQGVISTVTGFMKEKFPMMKDAVDKMSAPDANTTQATANKPATAENHNIMDKISDLIPGETGEKIEGFAKDAANKAEGVFDTVKDKLSGLFNGNKK